MGCLPSKKEEIIMKRANDKRLIIIYDPGLHKIVSVPVLYAPRENKLFNRSADESS
jgi:hypothetical protein